MEHREIEGMILSTRTDELFGISYALVLSRDLVESVKLPTQVANYKFGHLLNPNYVLQLELIKTKKNWVLKGISIYDRIAHPATYEEFLKQSECIKLVLKHLHEDQQANILPWLVGQMQQIGSLNLTEFERQLIAQLGFGTGSGKEES